MLAYLKASVILPKRLQTLRSNIENNGKTENDFKLQVNSQFHMTKTWKTIEIAL